MSSMHGITWSVGGGTATVAEADGTLVTLISTRPFPPGAPVMGTLTTDEGMAWGFTLKMATARKVDPTHWSLRGRLTTCPSDVLAAFAAAARGASGSPM